MDRNTKTAIIKKIRSILNNRRTVFFSKYPDSRKQQIILDAECRITMLQKADDTRFVQFVKAFNDRYIYPLIPSSSSPMHKSITALYEKINSL